MGKGLLLKFKGDKDSVAKKNKKSKKSKGTAVRNGVTVVAVSAAGAAVAIDIDNGNHNGNHNDNQIRAVVAHDVDVDGQQQTEVRKSIGEGVEQESQAPASQAQAQPPPPPCVPTLTLGAGKITTSGTVVMGVQGTKFMKEFKAGDAIVVGREMRVVKMRLSDISLNLSSAFSHSLSIPTPFHYVTKPRNEVEEIAIKQKHLKELEEEKGRTAFGSLYKQSDTLVYREKSTTGTSYVIRSQTLGHNATRSSLLDMRSKKKSDKYCN
jgi:hypothetical protein